MNADEMSLQDAFAQGQRAASFSHGATMNPFQAETPEHAEWERGRMGALGMQANPTRRTA